MGFNVSEIPVSDARNIGATFFRAMQKFYDNSANLKAYEDWRKKKEEEKTNDGSKRTD